MVKPINCVVQPNNHGDPERHIVLSGEGANLSPPFWAGRKRIATAEDGDVG
jgi:hypothetical protein